MRDLLSPFRESRAVILRNPPRRMTKNLSRFAAGAFAWRRVFARRLPASSLALSSRGRISTGTRDLLFPSLFSAPSASQRWNLRGFSVAVLRVLCVMFRFCFVSDSAFVRAFVAAASPFRRAVFLDLNVALGPLAQHLRREPSRLFPPRPLRLLCALCVMFRFALSPTLPLSALCVSSVFSV
jgi:hypothetical protein